MDLALTVGLGIARGATVAVEHRDGVPFVHYGPATVTLWLVLAAARTALSVVTTAHGASELAGSADVLFMLGLSLLIQNAMAVRRAAKLSRPRTGAAVRV